MTETMRAAVITDQGLTLQTLPIPLPTDQQLLVRVQRAALNRADLGMVAGHRHGQAGGAGAVAGLEWSGDVVFVGNQVKGYQLGDRVMCAGTGGYAEYALADPARTHLIPQTAGGVMSYAQAACLPVALTTMHDAIVTLGGLQAGQAVLIQGASSGVGIVGLQIARHMGAALVIGTSSSAERRAQLASYGADLILDSSQPQWYKHVLDVTGQQGVDVTVDQVSGHWVNDNMRATRVTGTIVNVGRLGGMRGEFDFDLHALRRINYVGATFRTRSRTEVALINHAMRRDLWQGVEDQYYRVPVAREFNLEQASEALDCMAENRHFGKILLAVREANAD